MQGAVLLLLLMRVATADKPGRAHSQALIPILNFKYNSWANPIVFGVICVTVKFLRHTCLFVVCMCLVSLSVLPSKIQPGICLVVTACWQANTQLVALDNALEE